MSKHSFHGNNKTFYRPITQAGITESIHSINKATVDSRLHSQCATRNQYFWYLLLSKIWLESWHCCACRFPSHSNGTVYGTSYYDVPQIVPLCEKNDVIHKTGSTQHIAVLPGEKRSRAICNTHKIFGKVRRCAFWVMRADRQKNRHTHLITILAKKQRTKPHADQGTFVHSFYIR